MIARFFWLVAGALSAAWLCLLMLFVGLVGAVFFLAWLVGFEAARQLRVAFRARRFAPPHFSL